MEYFNCKGDKAIIFPSLQKEKRNNPINFCLLAKGDSQLKSFYFWKKVVISYLEVSETLLKTTFDSSVCKKKTFGRAKKKVLNFLSVLFWHFVDFHSIIQGKKRKLLKYKKKKSKGCQAKDDWLCKLPFTRFWIPILPACGAASSVFNAEWKRHMRIYVEVLLPPAAF